MGRPAYSPSKADRMDVAKWNRAGASQEEIADALDIDPKTLRKYFEAELATSGRRYSLDLAASFKARALDWNQSPSIAITAVKTLLGWRELTPKDPDRRSVEDLTNEELAAIAGERARDNRERSGLGDPAPKKNRVVAA
jgi:hypothetical protein